MQSLEKIPGNKYNERMPILLLKKPTFGGTLREFSCSIILLHVKQAADNVYVKPFLLYNVFE